MRTKVLKDIHVNDIQSSETEVFIDQVIIYIEHMVDSESVDIERIIATISNKFGQPHLANPSSPDYSMIKDRIVDGINRNLELKNFKVPAWFPRQNISRIMGTFTVDSPFFNPADTSVDQEKLPGLETARKNYKKEQ